MAEEQSVQYVIYASGVRSRICVTLSFDGKNNCTWTSCDTCVENVKKLGNKVAGLISSSCFNVHPHCDTCQYLQRTIEQKQLPEVFCKRRPS